MGGFLLKSLLINIMKSFYNIFYTHMVSFWQSSSCLCMCSRACLSVCLPVRQFISSAGYIIYICNAFDPREEFYFTSGSTVSGHAWQHHWHKITDKGVCDLLQLLNNGSLPKHGFHSFRISEKVFLWLSTLFLLIL